MSTLHRRTLLAAAGSLPLASLPLTGLLSASVHAQPVAARRFEPTPGTWRSFELSTLVELKGTQGQAATVWVPLPSVDTPYQRSLYSGYSGNAVTMKVVADARYGARMLRAEFAAGGPTPLLQVTSRIQSQSRSTDFGHRVAAREDADTLRAWTQATELMPTDGIVRETARGIVGRATTDVEKVQLIYDWVVDHTHREPKVRGCGIGDIKAMLETQNFGGKCGDINALFVGLCRSVGVPARDVYGIRLVPSAFGYRELGGNPANLKGAQHCRAEVFLKQFGWAAMDPADVGKVMRQETPEWIKDSQHPLVSPVRNALFGGWEGNWLAYNMAHDVALPGSSGPKLGFLMYPQAEIGGERVDPLAPDDFRYAISARELTAA
ncbi:MAG: transglutaminase [Burkholderiales bacterium PBB5]|nr:MAG: transglutaminase [Burkholderiales bacterium PBB5]